MSASRVFATFNNAAKECGVSPATVRNWVVRGDIPAFKLPGHRAYFVDLNEAKEHAAKRQRNGTFGPDATVHDLSNVVGDFEVAQ